MLGNGTSSGCCGTGCGVCAQSLLRALTQTRKNLCHWSGGVPGCLGPAGPSYFWCWGRRCFLLTSNPLILGTLEYMGVNLPLGIVGLAAEFKPKVCSGLWSRLEGTCATGWVRFLCPWIPLVPVTPWCWRSNSDPMNTQPSYNQLISLRNR